MFRLLKILALALLAFTALDRPGAHAADRTFTVGFAQDNMGNDWRRAQVMAVQAELAKHANINFIFTDAQGDTAKNIQDIEDLVDRGIDLLVISPRDSQAMTPVLSMIYRSGLPVVLLTRTIQSDDYTSFVSADDAKIARAAADYIAKELGGAGKVLVLQGLPTASTAIKRTEGFLNAMSNHPGVDVVGVRPANYLRAEAIKVVEQAIEDGVEFDAIYAQSDSMAAGARLALKVAGIDPKSKLIVGIDYIPEAREAIRSGEQSATFTYPTAGTEGAALAVRILHGESVDKTVEVPSIMVTKDNVDKVDPVF